MPRKAAVVSGGEGVIGGAAACAFARAGARVFLAGRSPEKLDAITREIVAADGMAETVLVDALDEDAVNRHADAVATKAGSIEMVQNGGAIVLFQEGCKIS